MPYPVTGLYAGLLTGLYLFLALRVIRARYAHKQAYGASEQHPALFHAVRAHGNFQEYAPLFLILLFLQESGGVARGWCHAFGIVFLAGRASHAYSLLVNEPKGLAEKRGFFRTFGFRSLGMVCTFGVLGVMALMLLIQSL